MIQNPKVILGVLKICTLIARCVEFKGKLGKPNIYHSKNWKNKMKHWGY